MSMVGISIEIIFNANPKDVIKPNNKPTGTATDNSEITKYRLLGSKNNNKSVITRTVNIPKVKLSL